MGDYVFNKQTLVDGPICSILTLLILETEYSGFRDQIHATWGARASAGMVVTVYIVG